MRLLVFGGTRFVGRHIVEVALSAGHDVTTFTRGISGPRLFGAAVEQLLGDRDAGHLDALRGRRFDATIDVSAYWPIQVRTALAALQDCGHVTFISTVAVYRRPVSMGTSEGAPLVELDMPLPDRISSAKIYGGLKALCERALPRQSLIVRPGVVAGPYDPTERFTRWVRRAGERDRILAPSADQPVQIIDARDLAAFVVDGAARALTGTYNVVAPSFSFQTLLMLAGAEHRVVWASPQWLIDAGVRLGEEVPLAATSETTNDYLISAARAINEGLRTRALAGTIADVRAWDMARQPAARTDPFSSAREQRLLRDLLDVRSPRN